MAKVYKEIITPYTPAQMYRLVVDIENYPKYLPWCSKSQILDSSDTTVVGVVHLEYLLAKTFFTTKNTNYANQKIVMQLVDGPFKEFNGKWNFTPLGSTGCKINFSLNYTFSNIFIEKVIGPVFSFITKNIVESFINEAHKQYNGKN